MTPLPQQFDGRADQKAFKFTQLKRHKDVVLLEKQFKDGSSDSRWYEVIIVRNVPETRWPDGRTTPARETMPSPEEWGMCGWSPATLEDARKKFRLICDQQETKEEQKLSPGNGRDE